MRWLVAYDVGNDGDRAQVASALSRVGWRIQYSVFECDIDGRQAEDLAEDLAEVVNENRDRVHLFAVCDQCSDKRILVGQASAPAEALYFVV